ncbi:MAG: hypothetical protein NTU41_10255, partial [Chloroflexi bacterium]|nr:hypothetical protein [Chloroflexota bacterium]
ILNLRKVASNPAWEECWVEPANLADVHEAIRIIVEVSRALGSPGGPYIPADPQAPNPQPKTALQVARKTAASIPRKPVARGTETTPNREAKRAALIHALRHPTIEMRQTLEERKRAGVKDLDRDDWIWNALLGSFATMRNSRGYEGLIANRENYNRVTFEALSGLSPAERLQRLDTVLCAAKVRDPHGKAKWLHADYDTILGMGGLEEVRRQALAQIGTHAKSVFLMQFKGIGRKYGRNIWMDSYHRDFRETIAIDGRIKQVTAALGYTFANYTEHEQFYLAIAHEAGLQGWELDRLLYHFKDEFLAVVRWDCPEPVRSA